MLHMLQYDLANFSIPPSGATGKHKAAVEKAKQLLEEKPYEVISLEDTKMVRIDYHVWVDWVLYNLLH